VIADPPRRERYQTLSRKNRLSSHLHLARRECSREREVISLRRTKLPHTRLTMLSPPPLWPVLPTSTDAPSNLSKPDSFTPDSSERVVRLAMVYGRAYRQREKNFRRETASRNSRSKSLFEEVFKAAADSSMICWFDLEDMIGLIF